MFLIVSLTIASLRTRLRVRAPHAVCRTNHCTRIHARPSALRLPGVPPARASPARSVCLIRLSDPPAQHQSIADSMGIAVSGSAPTCPASIVSHHSQPAARHPIFSRFQPVEPVGCESPLTTGAIQMPPPRQSLPLYPSIADDHTQPAAVRLTAGPPIATKPVDCEPPLTINSQTHLLSAA